MTFDWNYLFSLFKDKDFWWATWTVIRLSVMSWVISMVLGFALALAKQSSKPVLRFLANLYIWFFRSLPLLVLLIFLYNMPQAVPTTSVVLSKAF